jgi:hypothetical protein
MIRLPEDRFAKVVGPLGNAPATELDKLLESAQIEVQIPLAAAARLRTLLSENDELSRLIRDLPWDESLSFAYLTSALAEVLPEVEGRDLAKIRIDPRDYEVCLCFALEAITDEKERRNAIASLEEMLPAGFSPFIDKQECGSATLISAFRNGLDDESRWSDAVLRFTALPESKAMAMTFWDLLELLD